MDFKQLKSSFGGPVLSNIFQRMGRLFTLICIFIVLIPLQSCIKFPQPDKDDEGHASFAREVIPVLLGRHANGVDEVEVVADISQLYGRNTAVNMLMKDTEFVDHWTDIIIDLLNTQRQLTGGLRAAQDSDCLGNPPRANPDPSIAEWVRDHAPGDPGAPTPAWNMRDLIRSAIVLDDLSPIYRANLFTMSMRLGGVSHRRNEVTDHFMRTYLNRDITCLRCHNPTYSASNKTNGSGDVIWRRLWNPTGHPEKALFGNYLDGTAALSRVRLVMRGDVRKPQAGGFGIRPWGISQECVKDTNNRSPSNNGTLTHTGFQILGAGTSNNPSAGFGSLDGGSNPKVSLWELEASLRQGIADLQDGYERFDPPPSADELVCGIVEVFSGNCVGCHSSPGASANMDLASDPVAALVNVDTQGSNSVKAKRVVPGNTTDSELNRRIHAASSPPRMPPFGGSLSAGNKAKIDDWIIAGAPGGDPANCNTSQVPDVHPDEAFAYLTASNLVDGIWMAAMGYRLTIDHGFPRNKKQRNALWNLTEYTFLSNDWSLKAVLNKILRSRWMGRRAPTISQADSAYKLPMMLNPWVEADPTEVTNPSPHEKANGQGDMVSRYRVNTLLRNIAAALGWKDPRPFPGGGYPSPLDQDLGQYLSPGVPGFTGVNFQSLLALESEVGLCNKLGKSVNSDDWINVLVAEVSAFNTANPDAPITLGEVWSILKDRMVQDPTIERHLPVELAGVGGAKTEEQALIAFFNEGVGTTVDLQSPTSTLSDAQLESKVREACGIVVKTPEFILTNVTPRGYSDNNMPDPPRLNVCLEGESCGYPSSCGKWRGVLNSMGKYTACEDRSVRKSSLIFLPIPPELIFELINRRFTALCPRNICGYLPNPRIDPCFKNPRGCGPIPPIPVDPIDPDDLIIGNTPSDLHEPGMLVMWAEGAVVQEATDVIYLRVGTSQWQPLRERVSLTAGDLLFVPLTASIKVKAGKTEFGASALKQKTIEGVSGHFISITGPSAEKVLDKHFTKEGALSFSKLRSATETELYDSRGLSEKDWTRVIAYGAKPNSKPTPTPEEIAKLNQNFDELHFPAGAGVAPDGTDLPESIPDGQEGPSEPNKPTGPESERPTILLYLLLFIIALIVIVVLIARRKP